MSDLKNLKSKKTYLVEATGGIAVKKQKYAAYDPDEASWLAFRNEAFYRAAIKFPGVTPERVMQIVEEGRLEMPDFKVRKITLVPSEVAN